MKREHVFIGRTVGRARVLIDVEISTKDATYTTTAHEKVTSVTRMSFMGEVVDFGKREPYMAGQIRDVLPDVTEYAPGWDAAKVKRLAEIWQEWHLNDMQAACDHQAVVWEDSDYGRRPSLDQTPACPESGYRYGTAWLVKPLPAEIEQEVRDMFAV